MPCQALNPKSTFIRDKKKTNINGVVFHAFLGTLCVYPLENFMTVFFFGHFQLTKNDYFEHINVSDSVKFIYIDRENSFSTTQFYIDQLQLY